MNPGVDRKPLLDRVSKMPPPELVKRIVELAVTLGSRLRYPTPARWRPGPPLAALGPPTRPAPRPQSEWAFFDRREALVQAPDWHKAGAGRWPLAHHSRLGYRPGNPQGDVRKAWEPNRLQYLPHLALVNPDAAAHHLSDWLDKNPYRYGLAWISSMEVAIRWVAIHRTLAILGPNYPEVTARVASLAHASGRFICHHLSTHSAAGNHLIVEALGLVWLGHATGRAQWHALGRRILHDQALRQIHPDGTSAEQTLWYLGFVVDAYLHWALLDPLPPAVTERLRASLDFLHEVVTPNGVYPDLGDRDDGYIFRSHGDYAGSPFPGLLEVGARLFGEPRWRRDSPRALERAAWWPGERPEPAALDPDPDRCRVRTYADGGLSSLRFGPGRLLFRHGPLGLAPTYGHGHADALSLTLTWGESPVLLDPGTGQYNGDQRVRAYFRSTRAHNTVELDGRDQAETRGPFLWKDTWRSDLGQCGPDQVQATCDAYQASLGVIHRRTVRWEHPREIVVVDHFEGPGGVPARWTWQVGGPAWLRHGSAIVEAGPVCLSVIAPHGTRLSLHSGEADPMLGWRSKLYGTWEPSPTLVAEGATSKQPFVTRLRISPR